MLHVTDCQAGSKLVTCNDKNILKAGNLWEYQEKTELKNIEKDRK